jgi:hypothetical protein
LLGFSIPLTVYKNKLEFVEKISFYKDELIFQNNSPFEREKETYNKKQS